MIAAYATPCKFHGQICLTLSYSLVVNLATPYRIQCTLKVDGWIDGDVFMSLASFRSLFFFFFALNLS